MGTLKTGETMARQRNIVGRTKQVKTSFYTTPEIKELLQNMAEESDKSLSLVINELLAEVLIEKQ